MVFLWFSYGFPMVFLWFSYGFPIKNQVISHSCVSLPEGTVLWFNHGKSSQRSHRSRPEEVPVLSGLAQLETLNLSHNKIEELVPRNRDLGWICGKSPFLMGKSPFIVEKHHL